MPSDILDAEVRADSLGYLSLDGLLRACRKSFGNRHCTACYTNDYPIPVTSAAPTKTEREEGSLLRFSLASHIVILPLWRSLFRRGGPRELAKPTHHATHISDDPRHQNN